MSYATNLQHESETQVHFVRQTARLRILHTDLTLHSGSVYKVYLGDWIGNFGVAFAFQRAAADYSLGASESLSTSEFYFDYATKYLYIRKADSSAPASTDFFVAHIYLFFASQDCIWYIDPLDDVVTATNFMVEWKGVLDTAPEFRITIPPLGLGFYPIEPTLMVLKDDQSLNYILSEGSFNRCACDCYHQVGELEIANIEQIISGLTANQIDIDNGQITFQVVDKSLNFDKPVPCSYYGTTDGGGGNIDPRFVGSPIMTIWGLPLNEAASRPVFEMVNANYNSTTPGTGNNRNWLLVTDDSTEYDEILIDGTMRLGGTDIFRPTAGSADTLYFRQNDPVWFDADAGPGSDQYLIIDSVGGSNVNFTTVPTGGSNQAGDLRVSSFKFVYLIKGGTAVYPLKFGRDYINLGIGTARGITLTATCEANLGVATFDPANDAIWCAPVGKRQSLSFSGFPANDHAATYKGAFSAGINILYDFALKKTGLVSAEIDYAALVTAQTYASWDMFAITPLAQQQDTPTIREVLDLMLRTMLLRAYFTPGGVLTFTPYKPADDVTADYEVPREDIMSSRYLIDYSEMAKVQFQNVIDAQATTRIMLVGGKSMIVFGGGELKIVQTPQVNQIGNATTTSAGEYLNKINKSIVFQHFAVDDESTMVSRVTDLYANRSGQLRIRTKKQNMQRSPGDVATVTRPSLLGAVYDGSDKSENFDTLELAKSQQGVDLTLDDTKAANDYSDQSYWP